MARKKSGQKTASVAAIIPAAGLPSNSIVRHSALPDAMLPINGKPVIGYILEDLLERGIGQAAVVLHPDDSYSQKYIEQKFSGRLRLHFVRVRPDRGVGYSIFRAAQSLITPSGVLVYLGDTIYKGQLDFSRSFLVASKNYDDPQKWCFALPSGGKYRFINKPRDYSGRGMVLCGLYFFRDTKNFSIAVKKAEKKFRKIEVSDILDFYQKTGKFSLVPARGWYDCGNIDNYYAAKVDFLRVRSFNRLSYDSNLGVITKSGDDRQKINQEINWYLNAPDELKMFAPRLFDYKIGKTQSEYSVEYYGYQTLADMYIFAFVNPLAWQSIIERLFEIVAMFKKYPSRLPYSYFTGMYVTKLHERLGQLRRDSYWKEILGLNEIVINGVAYKNLPYFYDKIEKMPERLYNKKDTAFIHGDLCLGNVLYDVDSRLIKLVDPRGYFGKMSVYGDIKYDLAKLRHSFSGNYDFLAADLFKLQQLSPGCFSFSVYAEDYHQQVAQKFDRALHKHGYDLSEIKYIEALLFLSMLPLHKNSPQRQKAMFLTGIQLINQALA